MMEPNGPPASAFETAAIEPRKIAPIAAQCFMPAPAKTRQYYCELQSECKVSFCSQRVWGRKKRAGGKMRVFLVAGGEGGIRTPDRLAPMPHFECGAFNHSATSP